MATNLIPILALSIWIRRFVFGGNPVFGWPAHLVWPFFALLVGLFALATLRAVRLGANWTFFIFLLALYSLLNVSMSILELGIFAESSMLKAAVVTIAVVSLLTVINVGTIFARIAEIADFRLAAAAASAPLAFYLWFVLSTTIRATGNWFLPNVGLLVVEAGTTVLTGAAFFLIVSLASRRRAVETVDVVSKSRAWAVAGILLPLLYIAEVQLFVMAGQ